MQISTNATISIRSQGSARVENAKVLVKQPLIELDMIKSKVMHMLNLCNGG